MNKNRSNMSNTDRGKLVAVIDAVSTQGFPIVQGLLRQGYSVRALVRNPDTNRAREIATWKGAELHVVDYTDQKSISRAFQEVWGVYAYTHFFLALEERYLERREGEIMVDSAIEAGVKYFIWSSAPDAAALTQGHLMVPEFTDHARVEQYIRSKNNVSTQFIFMYNGLFFQNLMKGSFGLFEDYDGNVIENPPMPLDIDNKLPILDSEDLGKIVPSIFNNPSLAGKRIPVFSDMKTMPEIIDAVARSAGLKGRFKSVDYAKFYEVTGDLAMEHFFRFLNAHGWYGRLFDKEELGMLKGIAPEMRDLDGWLKRNGTGWLKSAKELRPIATKRGSIEV
jgi:uncharacterized protein YbjT (DUF2867 family)